MLKKNKLNKAEIQNISQIIENHHDTELLIVIDRVLE